MTEEEAKNKWCPMVRLPFGDIAAKGNENPNLTSVNRNVDKASASCIGSDCMMWRISTKAGGGLREDHGYCGLGGKP